MPSLMKPAALVLACAAVTMTSACSPSTKVVHQQVTTTATATVTTTATPTVIRTVATRTATVTVTFTPPPPSQFSEGTYVVGTDIQPGVYHTAGSSDCMWERLSGLDPINDIITDNYGAGPQTVQIMASDKAFVIKGACTFGRIG